MAYFKFFNEEPHNVDAVSNFQLFASTLNELNDPFEGCVGALKERFESKAKEIMHRIQNRSEIICLARGKSRDYACSQLAMWAHYANSHKGFCVEYDEPLLTNGLKYGARENGYIYVQYSSFMPIVTSENAEEDEDKWFIEAISHKSSVWESENEVRMIFRNLTTDDKGHLHAINPQSVKAIYLGKDAKCELCTQLITFAKNNNIPCYKMTPSLWEYTLIPMEV